MPEGTGGHWFDTGSGPRRLSALSAHIVESGATSAYRAYLDHAMECEDCPQSTFQCEAAAGLWKAYLAARD